jgi:hypothetical protein
MPPDDQRAIDQLDEALDRAVSDDRAAPDAPSDADDLVRAHRQVEAIDRTPGPDPRFVRQLMGDLMHAPTQPISGNGRLAPPTHRLSVPVPREPDRLRIPAERRWGFAQLAIAVVVLIALGLGYRVFDRFSGPNRTSSIPAAFAPVGTPDAASPTATPFPRADHVIIGAWEVDWSACVAGTAPSRMIFDPDGTFVEYDSSRGVGIGRWRATGERTLEVVAIAQQYVSIESMFGVAENLPLPESFEVKGDGGIQVLSYTIEVDESGTSFIAQGFYEPRSADGSMMVHLEYKPDCPSGLPAYRMATVERTATP